MGGRRVTKKELIGYLHGWARLNLPADHWVSKKELNRFSSRKLYGAWQALAIRGEKRCGIIDKINRDKDGKVSFGQLDDFPQLRLDFKMAAANDR